MITDKQIEEAFKGTNFGHMDNPQKERRTILAQSIFKLICGYRTGYTIATILTELGMTKKNYSNPIKAARIWAYMEYHPIMGERS